MWALVQQDWCPRKKRTLFHIEGRQCEETERRGQPWQVKDRGHRRNWPCGHLDLRPDFCLPEQWEKNFFFLFKLLKLWYSVNPQDAYKSLLTQFFLPYSGMGSSSMGLWGGGVLVDNTSLDFVLFRSDSVNHLIGVFRIFSFKVIIDLVGLTYHVCESFLFLLLFLSLDSSSFSVLSGFTWAFYTIPFYPLS